MNITIAGNVSPSGYIPEGGTVSKEKTVLPEKKINPEMVSVVTGNINHQRDTVAEKAASGDFRPLLQDVIPSLLSDYDNKRMGAILTLCNVLMQDAVKQQERRNLLEEQVVAQAKQLQELKCSEADYQVAAAVVGAVVSVAVAVVGTRMSINGIDPANPGVMTAKGYMGQATSGLSQTIGQLFSQPIQSMGTRLQGDGEVVRGNKEVLLSAMSAHNKVSDDQKAFQKKLLDMLFRDFDNRKATAESLINNMKI